MVRVISYDIDLNYDPARNMNKSDGQSHVKSIIRILAYCKCLNQYAGKWLCWAKRKRKASKLPLVNFVFAKTGQSEVHLLEFGNFTLHW